MVWVLTGNGCAAGCGAADLLHPVVIVIPTAVPTRTAKTNDFFKLLASKKTVPGYTSALLSSGNFRRDHASTSLVSNESRAGGYAESREQRCWLLISIEEGKRYPNSWSIATANPTPHCDF